MPIQYRFKRQEKTPKNNFINRKVYENGSEVLESGNATIILRKHKVKSKNRFIMDIDMSKKLLRNRDKFEFKKGKFVKRKEKI